jgi:hypothetical protein
LAGEAAADDIDGNSVSGKSVGCKGSDVLVAGDAWPVLGEHSPAERIDLAEGDGAHACSFKAK